MVGVYGLVDRKSAKPDNLCLMFGTHTVEEEN